MNVKAYKAWDNRSVEPCSTVVFAKNVLEAKKIAIRSETCEDADYINIRAQRFPQMDKHYRGGQRLIGTTWRTGRPLSPWAGCA